MKKNNWNDYIFSSSIEYCLSLTILGFIIIIGFTFISAKIEYNLHSLYDGGPPITYNLALLIFIPIGSILFFLGAGKRKTKTLSIIQKIIITFIELVISLSCVIYIMLIYCKGGCL